MSSTMASSVTTTTYMTFRQGPTGPSSSASWPSCNDVGCKNPGNDLCRHPACVASNSLLVGSGYDGTLHGFLGRRLSYEQKKKFSFSLCFVAAFLTGTEFAIILPTVWRYLQQLGEEDERYIGYVTAAFSVGSILSHLVVGRIADQTRDSRKIILCVNLFQIVGQAIYAFGFNGPTLVAARLLSGVGIGLNSALFAEVVRGTNRSTRPWYIVGSFMARQLAIFLAPVYNSLVRNLPVIKIPFRNGYVVTLHEGSYPGLLMAVLWTAFQAAVGICFFNMTAERKADKHRQRQKFAFQEIRKAMFDSGFYHNGHGHGPSHSHKRAQSTEACTNVLALAVARSPSSPRLIPVKIKYTPNKKAPCLCFLSKSTPKNYSRVAGTPTHRKSGFIEPCDENQPLVAVLTDSGCHDASAEHEFGSNDAMRHAAVDDPDRRHYFTSGSATSSSENSASPFLKPQLDQGGSGRSSFIHGEKQRLLINSRGNAVNSQELYLSSVESIGHVSAATYCQEFLSNHAVSLLFMQFTVLACQTMVETAIPPVLQCYFKYGSKENSYMIMGMGAEELIVHGILLMSSGLIKSSKRVAPRGLLVVSCLAMLAGLTGLMFTSRKIVGGSGGKQNDCESFADKGGFFAHFVESCSLMFLGVPVGAVVSVSLLSQLLHYKVQGMGQGLGRFSCSLGMVIGPLWAGWHVYNPTVLYGGAFIVVCVELVLLAVTYPALKVPD